MQVDPRRVNDKTTNISNSPNKMHRLTTKKLTVRASKYSQLPPRSYQVVASASFYDSLPLFVSCDPDASSSDSYSTTTCQPSSFFSVVLLSFCRFCIKRVRYLATCRNVLAALDFNINAFENRGQLGVLLELLLIL